jgi:hypothetical protein
LLHALGVAIVAPMATLGAPVVDPAAAPVAAAERDRNATTSAVAPCEGDVTAEFLDEAFDEGIDGLVGADYQRSFRLTDGRVLWVFQDAVVDDGDGEPTLVHNAGIMQDGTCFDTLTGGTPDRPSAWIGSEGTQPFQRWYWPLDGYQRDDGTFVLFLAEMDERGSRYMGNSTPVATWTVEIDVGTLAVGELRRAPNPDERLYGFDVTTDDEHLYLYAQCHRQFGFGPAGHDDCAADVFVARQPLDEPNQPLEYWDGTEWTRNSRHAVSIAPRTGPDGEPRDVNPMQVERDGDRWIAVTKAGDWWGERVYFDVAPSPEGPWTTTSILPASTQGDPDEVAAYFVSFVPSDDAGVTLAISNNRWDGALSDVYVPRFETVTAAAWDERSIRKVTTDVWLPLGETRA